MVLLKFGSTGQKVSELQAHLGGLTVDGFYGRMTEAAVRNYQRKNGYEVTGKVSHSLWGDIFGSEPSTDRFESKTIIAEKPNPIYADRYYLPSHEYVDEETAKKEYIFLHHTAGWNNPYNTIQNWERDRRGRIATQFVVGGTLHNVSAEKSRAKKYDGVIVECFPDDKWAYHLGNVNSYMHKHSIGIELCSFGRLTKSGDRFYNWIGKEIHGSQVFTLNKPHKGQLYFHKYSKRQIDVLGDLIRYLGDLHQIDYTKGLPKLIEQYQSDINKAFDYSVDAKLGKVRGILSHSNVRTDKDDVYPDPYLIEMISRLV